MHNLDTRTTLLTSFKLQFFNRVRGSSLLIFPLESNKQMHALYQLMRETSCSNKRTKQVRHESERSSKSCRLDNGREGPLIQAVVSAMNVPERVSEKKSPDPLLIGLQWVPTERRITVKSTWKMQ